MTAMALLEHYTEYLTSPGVLLALLVVVAPILLSLAAETAAGPTATDDVPGCRRLGIVGRSNLDDHFKKDPPPSKHPRVKALFTYPVKSCRGVELAASEMEATGLKHDRLFTFAQLVSRQATGENMKSGAEVDGLNTDWKHEWRFITQRDFPKLALVQTELFVPTRQAKKPSTTRSSSNDSGSTKEVASPAEKALPPLVSTGLEKLWAMLNYIGLRRQAKPAVTKVTDWRANGGCLLIRFPFYPDYNFFGLRTEIVEIKLPLTATEEHVKEKAYGQEVLSIWKDNIEATNVTPEISSDALAKLKYFLGVSNPLALFRASQGHQRAVTRNLPQDQQDESYHIRFADAFPTNLLALASVRALDGELPPSNAGKYKLDARRFRANIYISGIPAYTEDTWKRITLGRRIGRNHQGLFEVDAEYHVSCRTARCKLPNVDPKTGERDKEEPYSTLRKTRRVDPGADPHPCLGMQMIPLFQLGMIKVGDEVNVLETGEHHYEKMFA